MQWTDGPTCRVSVQLDPETGERERDMRYRRFNVGATWTCPGTARLLGLHRIQHESGGCWSPPGVRVRVLLSSRRSSARQVTRPESGPAPASLLLAGGAQGREVAAALQARGWVLGHYLPVPEEVGRGSSCSLPPPGVRRGGLPPPTPPPSSLLGRRKSERWLEPLRGWGARGGQQFSSGSPPSWLLSCSVSCSGGWVCSAKQERHKACDVQGVGGPLFSAKGTRGH